MSLKLNVGLSKKVGEANYGSRGASVNVEMELDSGLVSEPEKLKERIRQIYNSLRSSVAEELNGGHAGIGHPNGNGQHAANGHDNGNGKPVVRPATNSQIKAIHAIARSQGVALDLFLRNRFQRDRPEDLTIKEASGAIDDLKRQE